jgi:hypothetical protein
MAPDVIHLPKLSLQERIKLSALNRQLSAGWEAVRKFKEESSINYMTLSGPELQPCCLKSKPCWECR